MKGKRKAKTSKWLMKAQIELEAQRLLAGRTDAASRFLNAALQAGQEHEPTGRLAG